MNATGSSDSLAIAAMRQEMDRLENELRAARAAITMLKEFAEVTVVYLHTGHTVTVRKRLLAMAGKLEGCDRQVAAALARGVV